jgi:hypothetical protein
VLKLTKVDTKRIVILIVPAKSGKNHANISPRYCHARYIRLDESKKRFRHDRDVVEIPRILGVLIEGMSLHGRHCTGSGDESLLSFVVFVVGTGLTCHEW